MLRISDLVPGAACHPGLVLRCELGRPSLVEAHEPLDCLRLNIPEVLTMHVTTLPGNEQDRGRLLVLVLSGADEADHFHLASIRLRRWECAHIDSAFQRRNET